MPNDGGHLLLDNDEKTDLLNLEPNAAPYLRQFLGAEEFINDIPRWCLWLTDITPQALKALPSVRARIAAVKKHRLESSREATRRLALEPHLFGEIRQPDAGDYLLIPSISSERRTYIPIGFFSHRVIASNKAHIIPNASLYEFGILTSKIHMAWMRYTTGRLKSDYQYSNTIVYNNFPWPEALSDKTLQGIEAAAQTVLDVRAGHQAGAHPASLATLYDPDLMPSDLRKAHTALDGLVDKLYGLKKAKPTDQSRVALLFERYQALVTRIEQAQSTPKDSESE
jgi:hypothetical protein